MRRQAGFSFLIWSAVLVLLVGEVFGTSLVVADSFTSELQTDSHSRIPVLVVGHADLLPLYTRSDHESAVRHAVGIFGGLCVSGVASLEEPFALAAPSADSSFTAQLPLPITPYLRI